MTSIYLRLRIEDYSALGPERPPTIDEILLCDVMLSLFSIDKSIDVCLSEGSYSTPVIESRYVKSSPAIEKGDASCVLIICDPCGFVDRF